MQKQLYHRGSSKKTQSWNPVTHRCDGIQHIRGKRRGTTP
ncbi:rCG38983 [Rattus norvegicus]|uniref:RCG38983 n=1 Tax=Rattus norvegicus TaxID=10116 RepID=A6KQ85_RAT|nr:rCG38983 [Rattus norvegicus]